MHRDNEKSRPDEHGDDPVVDPRIDQLVGEKLRAYYDGLVGAPAPDKIIELINLLRSREGKDKT